MNYMKKGYTYGGNVHHIYGLGHYIEFFLYRLVTFLVVFMIALSLDHLVLLVLLLLHGISVESWCIHDGL